MFFVAATHQDPSALAHRQQADITKIVGRFQKHLLGITRATFDATTDAAETQEAAELLGTVLLQPRGGSGGAGGVAHARLSRGSDGAGREAEVVRWPARRVGAGAGGAGADGRPSGQDSGRPQADANAMSRIVLDPHCLRPLPAGALEVTDTASYLMAR